MRATHRCRPVEVFAAASAARHWRVGVVEAAALGLFVDQDWKHDPALSARDAYHLVDGSARQNLEHENAWRRHTIALAEWQEARDIRVAGRGDTPTQTRHCTDEDWRLARVVRAVSDRTQR